MNMSGNAAGMDDFFDQYVTAEPTAENSSFLNSLDTVTAEELSGNTDKPLKKKKSRSNILFDFAAVACFAVFCLCFYRVIIISAGYTQSDRMYEAIAEDYIMALSGKNGGIVRNLLSDKSLLPLKPGNSGKHEEEKNENGDQPSYEVVTGSLQYQQILVFLENLRLQNSDTFGYIHIDGTKISFPVVQSAENGYYLTHSFEKTYLKSGTIYIDSRNSRNVEKNRNIIFYGHNLTNGGMFHHVVDFLKEDVFMNSDIVISTFDGIYTFRVFSIYPTISTGDYFRVYFRNDEDFIEFCEQEEKRSLFHKDGIEFSGDSIIITLSTCIHGQTDGRYALHAVLTGVEK